VPPKIAIGDIWYALFRHKWKVILLAVLGVVASGILYVSIRPSYVSKAKLLVRYVVETRSVEAPGPDGQLRTSLSGSESVVNSECEILKSLDLCRKVAETIGPGKVLAKTTKGSNAIAAAGMLYAGLTVEPARKSNVIQVSMTHPDPEVAQLALEQLIDLYFKRHVEIHRALGTMDAFLAEQTDQVRSRLVQMDEELRNLRTKSGVLSLEDTKKSYTEQIGNIRQMILSTEADLAEHQSLVAAAVVPSATNGAAASNLAGVVSPPASMSRYPEYKALLARLETLHTEEMLFRRIYTDDNRTLQRTREQLAEAQALRKSIELEHPGFAGLVQYPQSSGQATAPVLSSFPAPVVDPGRARSLETKIKVLNEQLEKVRKEALALEEYETSLTQLQRKRELDERNYRHFAAGLEQARFDEALGSGNIANISVVQHPSPPALEATKRLKFSGMALAAGLLGGIGLALLIEFALDQTVRRPLQFELALGVPLFATIPRVNSRQRDKLARTRNGANGATAGSDPDGGMGPSIPGWSHGHPLRSHIIALRDRTLMHFETDTHKPKLIGVTGCRAGVGVTTVASALAAALSEAGQGRVLLANLNTSGQSGESLIQGREICPLVDVIEKTKRETAQIGDNLYLAGSQGSGTEILPTSMSRLVPKLKVSDYDYVVFDMPCLSRATITSKLAGMLDLVFVVAESEKDTQVTLRSACQLLAENNVTFRMVLNKFRRYAPAGLHQEM